MFEMGEQGTLLSYPYKDPYENARASMTRFNWGVQAENFVIPMTGYVTEERNRRTTVTKTTGAQTDFDDEKNLPPAEEQDTFQKANERTLTQLGFTINKDKYEDGSQPVTKVATDAREPAEDQPPAELSTVMLRVLRKKILTKRTKSSSTHPKREM